MENPLLDLSSSSNWSQVYSDSFTANTIAGTNKFSPIPAIRIPSTFDKHIIAVGASSFQTKPTWRLGFWLSMYVDLPNIGKAEGCNKSIPLGLSIVRLPSLSSTYSLVASIPKWHTEMSIDIWQYVGNVSDLNSAISELESNLLRIESKVDALNY